MRAYSFLIEYNMTSLINIFGDKLMAKWQAEGEPFKDQISDNEEITAEDLMRWMEKYDPTQNNKYITWIVNKYAGKKGGIARLEDIPSQLADVLDTYEKLSRKNLLKPEHKNINQIKTLSDLHDITDEYKEEDTSSKQETNKAEEQAFYNNDEAELIFNNNEYKIIIPKTKEASCYFGKNTRWCTAGDRENMFDYYNKNGSLYVILHKATNEKWQWNFESGQYMDARDRSIDMDEFLKKHKTAANAVIKHYGGLEKAATSGLVPWLKYIENPSEETKLAAVTHNGDVIRYVKNSSEEIKLAAVTQFGQAIGYIKNPSEAVQIAAVKERGDAIQFIKNPSNAVKLAAANQNAETLEYIENPSEETQLAGVKEDGEVIEYIIDNGIIPSEAVQLAAVNNDGDAIKYIENPSDAVKIAAQENNNESINLNRLQTLSGIK